MKSSLEIVKQICVIDNGVPYLPVLHEKTKKILHPGLVCLQLDVLRFIPSEKLGAHSRLIRAATEIPISTGKWPSYTFGTRVRIRGSPTKKQKTKNRTIRATEGMGTTCLLDVLIAFSYVSGSKWRHIPIKHSTLIQERKKITPATPPKKTLPKHTHVYDLHLALSTTAPHQITIIS